ncbi:hypothetical protein NHU_03740 [Rhodovulum sulfidophilum]|uniref:Uncharacterized protein n=1 Tax=Rhodovulum sulfidophilum TaxID=35806 RepID=A0A0D6B752_RHOSU|nr:hypothetical protein NHU_03740 [Rhodovulum sulfidophilum]
MIHIAERALEDESIGTPRLERVWNRLMDLDKLLGGSAEMYRQNVAMLMHLKADLAVQWDPGEAEAPQGAGRGNAAWPARLAADARGRTASAPTALRPSSSTISPPHHAARVNTCCADTTEGICRPALPRAGTRHDPCTTP